MSINTKTNISSRTKNSKKEVEIIDSEKISMKKLIDIEQTIFNLTYENIDLSIKKINKLFDSSYPYSDNLIICNLVYFAFCSKRNSCDLYINYIETLQSKEVEVNKNNQNFTEIFIDDLCKRGSQESYYLINQMIERNIIDKKITKKIKSKYFAHLKKKEEIQYINLSDPRERIFNDNFDKLSKNDWELHKKLIKEGQSPNEIAKIIRNDEIEKLQEISTQNEFNFNQIIEPSLYERCSFINQRNVSLIDCAAFFGSIKCFKFLLMNGANVNNTGKYAIAGGNVEIIHLCEQNNASFDDAYETAIMYHRNDIFKYFYERNLKEAQPKTTSNYMINSFAYENNIVKLYENLLCLCITSGNYEILSNLLENGMKINDNVINITAKTGNLYLVKYFLQHYQIPNNIIVYASDSGNIELVKYIFEQERKKLNSKDNDGKIELFITPLKWNNETIIMFRKQNVYAINAKNISDNGNTALICASKNGYAEIVKLLLEQEGIDINTGNNNDYSALMLASREGCTEIVKLLLEQERIDINTKSNDGYSALMLASENGHIEIVKLLLEQEGIDINAQDKDGFTALIWAFYYDHIKIVKLLLEQKGIDVNAKNNWGQTALILAAEKGCLEIVKLLLKQEGIDINAKNRDGCTALITSSRFGYTDIVKLLLEKDEIDINAQDSFGRTSLMRAASNCHQEIVKFLLEQKGIDTNIKNKNGKTALICATDNGNTEIVKIIQEHKETL